jgi:hypothetical protein
MPKIPVRDAENSPTTLPPSPDVRGPMLTIVTRKTQDLARARKRLRDAPNPDRPEIPAV